MSQNYDFNMTPQGVFWKWSFKYNKFWVDTDDILEKQKVNFEIDSFWPFIWLYNVKRSFFLIFEVLKTFAGICEVFSLLRVHFFKNSLNY